MINGDGPQVQKPVYYFTSYHILQGMTIEKGAIHFTLFLSGKICYETETYLTGEIALAISN